MIAPKSKVRREINNIHDTTSINMPVIQVTIGL